MSVPRPSEGDLSLSKSRRSEIRISKPPDDVGKQVMRYEHRGSGGGARSSGSYGVMSILRTSYGFSGKAASSWRVSFLAAGNEQTGHESIAEGTSDEVTAQDV